MVIFGWLRRFTVLGTKLDECANCGNICEHAVGRKTHWGHVFWLPVLFLGFRHGMVCTVCGEWTGIPWKTIRTAMKSGTLSIEHPRLHGQDYLESLPPDPGGFTPRAAAVFDRFVVNPKRGFWDLYLKAWPVLALAVILVGAFAPKSPAFATGSDSSVAIYGPAHQCWEASDGSINGCRLADGSMDGSPTGTPLTCYFYEPLPTSDTTIRCDAT